MMEMAKQKKSATREMCSMKIVQHEQSIETEKTLGKTFKERAHYADNWPYVNGPLYTGI